MLSVVFLPGCERPAVVEFVSVSATRCLAHSKENTYEMKIVIFKQARVICTYKHTGNALSIPSIVCVSTLGRLSRNARAEL